MTKQRKLIHDIIYSSMDHLTADSIHRAAQEVMPSIAVGTVYRNLGLMCESGEIMRVVIDNEPDRFDKNPVYHGHAICEKCKSVWDIDTDGLCDILSSRTESPILSYNITVHCYCDKCRDN